MSLDNEVVRTLAELTLVLILCTDASRIDIGVLRRNNEIPLRLLAIAMPLTIALGVSFGVLLFSDLGLWEVTLLAAILAPTDAALGLAMVTNPREPVRLRQALNVESGLNDGIAVPFITLFIAGSVGTVELQDADFWIEFALKQIGFGLLISVGVGVIVRSLMAGGWLTENIEARCRRTRDLMSRADHRWARRSTGRRS